MLIDGLEAWDGKIAVAVDGMDPADLRPKIEAMLAAWRPDLEDDLALLSRRSRDVLPRSPVARHAADAMRQVGQALNITDDDRLPPPVVALPGAIVDELLVTAIESGASAVRVGVSDAMAAYGTGVTAAEHADPVLLELDHVAGGSGRRGLAWAGLGGSSPICGLADRVAFAAGSAAVASYCAATVADAVSVAGAPVIRRQGVSSDHTRQFKQAFEKSDVSCSVGPMPADQIWEALSSGVRRALALRQARLVRAGVLTLKGRGRVIGPIDQNQLLRFGVSDWR